MNLKVLELLEFDKVKQQMFKYVKTEKAKSIIENLQPFCTIEEVNRNLNETNEALNFIKEFEYPDFNGLNDIVSSIEKISKSGIVTVKEIYRIGTTLKCIRGVRNYLEQGNVEYLKYYFDNIHSFKFLEEAILLAKIYLKLEKS